MKTLLAPQTKRLKQLKQLRRVLVTFTLTSVLVTALLVPITQTDAQSRYGNGWWYSNGNNRQSEGRNQQSRNQERSSETPATTQRQAPAENTPTPVAQTPPVAQPTQSAPVAPVEPVVQASPPAAAPVVVTHSVEEVDTSAAVVTTAQSQTKTPTLDGTVYTTNRLDPAIAQTIALAGTVLVGLGMVAYSLTFIPTRKVVRHIPVRVLS